MVSTIIKLFVNVTSIINKFSWHELYVSLGFVKIKLIFKIINSLNMSHKKKKTLFLTHIYLIIYAKELWKMWWIYDLFDDFCHDKKCDAWIVWRFLLEERNLVW